MSTYARSEIISSSKTAKNLGRILEDLKTGKRKRAVISKNNELDAVILPIEEYEKMNEIIELIERMEISQIIKERSHSTAEIPFEEILKKNSIDIDALQHCFHSGCSFQIFP